MKCRIWVSLACASLVLVVPGHPVQAHHSIPAYYDVNKTISVTGILKQIKIINPHSSILLEATDSNGQKVTWLAVLGSGTQMSKSGWNSTTIKVGTTVTIDGNPARAEGAKGLIVKSITMPDGKKIDPGQVD